MPKSKPTDQHLIATAGLSDVLTADGHLTNVPAGAVVLAADLSPKAVTWMTAAGFLVPAVPTHQQDPEADQADGTEG